MIYQKLSKLSEEEILIKASQIFKQKKDLIISDNLKAEEFLLYYKKMYELSAEYPLDLKRKF